MSNFASQRRHERMSRGFTLVELLMATVVGALVTIIAVATLHQVSQVRERLTYWSEAGAHGRQALRYIQRDVTNLFRHGDPSMMLWEGTKVSTRTGHAPHLTLTVLAAAGDRTNEYQGELCEVEYGLVHTNEKGLSLLARRCGPLEYVGQRNDGGNLSWIAENVAKFELSYFDGRDWQQHWQSTTSLPRLVWVSVTVADPKGKFDPLTVSQTITVAQPPTYDTESPPAESTDIAPTASTGGGTHAP